MSFRPAAYAVCAEDGRVLLAHHVSKNWTFPGGRVEHAEDPFDAVIREVAEETGCDDRPEDGRQAAMWKAPNPPSLPRICTW